MTHSELAWEFADLFGSRDGRPRLPRVEYVFRCADGSQFLDDGDGIAWCVGPEWGPMTGTCQREYDAWDRWNEGNGIILYMLALLY